jgi:cobalamin biosynthesis protein CobT
MSSNSKTKTPSKESPNEPFKRAVSGALRAIARKPDLEVSYAAEKPGLSGNKARLPEPPRRLTAAEAAVLRGHADAMALKLACHNPTLHRRLSPAGQQARAVFEAVEQARVEAIGARRMDGIAQNLAAMHQDRFHRNHLDVIKDRDDAPIEEAIAMMVRERLTRSVRAMRSINSPRISRTSAVLATSFMMCSVASIWARTAAKIPKARKTIPKKSRKVARKRPAKMARLPSPPRSRA